LAGSLLIELHILDVYAEIFQLGYDEGNDQLLADGDGFDYFIQLGE
jgi:hypothetical protein